MSHDDTLVPFTRALVSFVDAELDLIKIGVNERSLTHKLGEHLQRVFPDWHVDCEYNRLGMGRKLLPAPETVSSDDTDGVTIYPDIIVHKRQLPANLLVIEMKKTTNNKPGDDHKLKGLTSLQGEYCYKLGIHVIVDCERGGVASVICYTRGSIDDALSTLALDLLAKHASDAMDI